MDKKLYFALITGIPKYYGYLKKYGNKLGFILQIHIIFSFVVIYHLSVTVTRPINFIWKGFG